MKKLLPKFNKTPFIQFAQKGSKTKTTKVEEEELPEEEIETWEEINQPIPVVVVPPKPVPVYGPSSPVVRSYGFDPTQQPWSTQFSEDDKANYKEVPNNKDAGLYVPREEAGGDYDYITKAKERVKSSLSELQKYWAGPVAKHRLKYMGKQNDEDAGFDDKDVEEKRDRVDSIKAIVNPSVETVAHPYKNIIKINPYLSAFNRNQGSGMSGLTAHEAAHIIYRPDEMTSRFQFSPEYKKALDKISPEIFEVQNGPFVNRNPKIDGDPLYIPYVGEQYYINEGPRSIKFTYDKYGNPQPLPGDKNHSHIGRDKYQKQLEDSRREHDSDINEKIPFIYETRDAMRKSGYWDYTTGQPLTDKTLRNFKLKFPNTRLLNYTDDDNALWLLNVTAQNNTENTQHNMA